MYHESVRKWVSLLACMALVLGFIQAPFTHVHEHEETSHHPGAFLHSHYHHSVVPSNTPRVSDLDPDDDAHDLKWFSVAVDHYHLQLAPPAKPFLSFEVAEASEPNITPAIESGHDPPDRLRSSPRAPPL